MTADVYAPTSWMPKRIAPPSRHGMVAAKMPQAARVGADILARGGNAVDAAVATAFAVGVCEPWMNGLGGGGYMVVWLAEEQRALVIDYHMRAPKHAKPDMYPLVQKGDVDAEAGFFGWPATEGNRHVMGPHSIAVPGNVAGLALALERFGTLGLPEVLEPAIRLAEEGFPVTWNMTTSIAKSITSIRMFPETAKTFLTPGGDPLVTIEQATPAMIRQPELAETLRRIAADGPDAFYRGEIAAKITEYMQAEGTVFTADDLASYEARIVEPHAVAYHGHTVYTNPGGSGGTSLAQALTALDLVDSGCGERSVEQWHTMAHVFRQAFADRFSYLADPEFEDVPIDALLGEDHARRTIDSLRDRATTPTPGDRAALGVTHTLAASVPEYMKDGSTTQLNVVDAEGNAVSITQTLLSLFGSRVTIPGTGVLMNNGMMWFDPEPGRPNSVAGGKQPLTNMAPAVVVKDGTVVASLGASGGRKIMNSNAQQVMNIVDRGMSAQDAIDAPRIDCSTTELVVSSRESPVVIDGLKALGYPVGVRHEGLLTADFSSPMAIRRSADGMLDGGADPWYFPATVVGVEGS